MKKNKRSYKKRHTDFYERLVFHYFIDWINLYKNEVKNKLLQKQGKYANRRSFPEISKTYIKWYKDKI